MLGHPWPKWARRPPILPLLPLHRSLCFFLRKRRHQNTHHRLLPSPNPHPHQALSLLRCLRAPVVLPLTRGDTTSAAAGTSRARRRTFVATSGAFQASGRAPMAMSTSVTTGLTVTQAADKGRAPTTAASSGPCTGRNAADVGREPSPRCARCAGD